MSNSVLIQPRSLEAWARQTIDKGMINEWEFGENLDRIGCLGRIYGFFDLGELFVNMTMAGLPFDRVLLLLERGEVPWTMRL